MLIRSEPRRHIGVQEARIRNAHTRTYAHRANWTSASAPSAEEALTRVDSLSWCEAHMGDQTQKRGSLETTNCCVTPKTKLNLLLASIFGKWRRIRCFIWGILKCWIVDLKVWMFVVYVPRSLMFFRWDYIKKKKKALAHQRSLQSLRLTDTAHPAPAADLPNHSTSKPLPCRGLRSQLISAWGEKPSAALKGWGWTNVHKAHTGQTTTHFAFT